MNDRQVKKLFKRIKKTRDDYLVNNGTTYLNFTPRCVSWINWQLPLIFSGKHIGELVVLMSGAGGDIDKGLLKQHNKINIKEIERQAKISKPHTPTLDEKLDILREGE